MPKKSGKSGLAAKYGSKLDDAMDSHGGDETNYGGLYGQLPGGIRRGIAQLSKCYFSQYEKGDNKDEYYFRAEGVVIEPNECDGQIVKGLMTSIMEPVCETTKRNKEVVTIEDHMKTILNEMRKLGVDTEGAGSEDLERLAEDLVEAAPYFFFGTSQSEATDQYPNPRVWENWNGSKGLEDYEPEIDDGVVDKTTKETTAKVKEREDVPFGDELDTLADQATRGDKDSANELSEIASKAGLGESFVENAKSWEIVTEAIRKAQSNEKKDDESEDLVAIGKLADKNDEEAQGKITQAGEKSGVEDDYETWVGWVEAILIARHADVIPLEESEYKPDKEDIVFYKPPRAKKSIECEVTAVFTKKKICNLKSNDDGKVYKAVPWDKISVE